MSIATLLPAVGALALTFSVPQTNHQFLGAAAFSLGAPADAAYKLWHGWTPALGLGMTALGLAFLVWRVLRSPVLAPMPVHFSPIFEPLFYSMLHALRSTANRVSRYLSGGSLGVQICVTLGTIGFLTLIALKVYRIPMPDLTLPREASPLLLLSPVIMIAAIAAAKATKPLAMLVSLGFVGLLIAFLFLWFSAPDLALTQLLAETLLLFLLAGVVFKFRNQTGKSVPGRSIIALIGGVLVSLLILKSMALEWDHPISDFHLTRSKPEAFGANVVNVILVDFRALDTLGEIVVLGIAALAATASLGAARLRAPLPNHPPSEWLSTASKVVLTLLLPLSLWIFWRGHNSPGGGFIGALVAASGIGLALLAGLSKPNAKTLRHASHWLCIAGLGVALLSAITPLLVGKSFFAGLWWHSGDLHLGTPLLFDLGVYLTVLGFCVTYLRYFLPNAR